MEDWRKKLDLIQKKIDEESEVTIIDEEVTGVKALHYAPDNLFYSEFSEADAEAFFAIFEGFRNAYNMNKNLAIKALSDNIELQIDEMSNNVCPVEVILFASRSIKDLLSTDPKLFKEFKNLIAKHIGVWMQKSAWYILSGWEWKHQLAIFVEAIGESNDATLLKLAMDYYDRIAKLCIDKEDCQVLKSYINMILATQNSDYFNYLADIVSNSVFSDNAELVEYFINKCKTTDFIKREPQLSDLIWEISDRNIPSEFRIKLNYLKPKEEKVKSSVIEDLNSSLSYEKKKESVAGYSFENPKKALFECESVRDRTGCILICGRIMEEIENIYPPEMRGNFYILLGTKGRYCKSDIVEFLTRQKENDPEYLLQINVALRHLQEIGPNEAYNTIFTAQYRPFWGKNLGKYFRFNKTVFTGEFIPFLSKVLIDNSFDEDLILKSTSVLNDVMSVFRDKLNDPSYPVPDKLLDLIFSFPKAFVELSIYNEVLELLSTILKECPSKTKRILSYLDQLRQNLSSDGSTLSISTRIISLIKKGETYGEPD